MKQFMFMLFLCVLCANTLFAQDEMPKGFRGDFLTQLKDVETKFIGLAEAFPQEKYVWRPSEGVRSVSEVFMHMAGANYLFPKFFGVEAPEGLSQDMEKTVTEKGKVIEMLRQSFAHIKRAVMSAKDSDLENSVKMFGRETTVRGSIFTSANHMHEHLGQAIAYARMNSIVPPWNAKEQSGGETKK